MSSSVLNESPIVDDAVLKSAVSEILSNIDPEQATFRQIRDKLNTEHNINTDGKKELILTLIEKFFSGEDAEDNESGKPEDESDGNVVAASKPGKQDAMCWIRLI